MKRILLLAVVLVCGCSSHKPSTEDLINGGAGVKGTLPYPVMSWKVLGSGADRSANTVSTLFGNDAAVAAARGGVAWPQGTVLGLVTWREKEDAHWFGGRIPDAPVMVEFVEFKNGDMAYRRFGGPTLTEASPPYAGGSWQAHADVIAAMRPVRLP